MILPAAVTVFQSIDSTLTFIALFAFIIMIIAGVCAARLYKIMNNLRLIREHLLTNKPKDVANSAPVPAPKADTPSIIYYYDSGEGNSAGPVSIDVLRMLQAKGTITGDTQVFSERTQVWEKFRALKA